MTVDTARLKRLEAFVVDMVAQGEITTGKGAELLGEKIIDVRDRVNVYLEALESDVSDAEYELLVQAGLARMGEAMWAGDAWWDVDAIISLHEKGLIDLRPGDPPPREGWVPMLRLNDVGMQVLRREQA